jgi:glycosyltransferase involved in cell wall biosynthesis
LGTELVILTAGGPAGNEAGIRYAPIETEGPEDAPARRRWHLPSLRKALSEHRPELVHLEADPDTPLAADLAGLARKSGIPYLLFSWQSLPTPSGWWTSRRVKTVLGSAGGVIGGNPLAMELLRQRAPQAIAGVIPQAGVDLPRPRSPREGEPLTMAFAGRLVPERGADLLIRALGQTFGNWRLLIAGTGPEQEELEELIQRLGSASRIHWLGGLRREALDQVFREADCLVVPSRDTPDWVEYHSPVLLEAMASGIAPLVTRAGCLPHLVGDAGVVVEGVDQLADMLQAWVAEPEKCRSLGAAPRQRVLERYVTGAIAAQTLTLWRAVLDQTSRAGPQ